MLEQVSKNIAERAENRNRLGSASNKVRVGKCNLGSMGKVATSAIGNVLFVLKKAHTATTKLMFYVMGSTPIIRTTKSRISPSWLGQKYYRALFINDEVKSAHPYCTGGYFTLLASLREPALVLTLTNEKMVRPVPYISSSRGGRATREHHTVKI